MTQRPPTALPVLPLVMLGLMTIASFGGPLLIFFVVRGGARSEWPPDRPIEWWVTGSVIGLVLVLMGTCVTCGIWSKPR
jgi:hypothetical protein